MINFFVASQRPPNSAISADSSGPAYIGSALRGYGEASSPQGEYSNSRIAPVLAQISTATSTTACVGVQNSAPTATACVMRA
eukprot:SAG11_NODE_1333_length_5179_cov_3.502953_1_plen_82_part_00